MLHTEDLYREDRYSTTDAALEGYGSERLATRYGEARRFFQVRLTNNNGLDFGPSLKFYVDFDQDDDVRVHGIGGRLYTGNEDPQAERLASARQRRKGAVDLFRPAAEKKVREARRSAVMRGLSLTDAIEHDARKHGRVASTMYSTVQPGPNGTRKATPRKTSRRLSFLQLLSRKQTSHKQKQEVTRRRGSFRRKLFSQNSSSEARVVHVDTEHFDGCVLWGGHKRKKATKAADSTTSHDASLTTSDGDFDLTESNSSSRRADAASMANVALKAGRAQPQRLHPTATLMLRGSPLPHPNYQAFRTAVQVVRHLSLASGGLVAWPAGVDGADDEHLASTAAVATDSTDARDQSGNSLAFATTTQSPAHMFRFALSASLDTARTREIKAEKLRKKQAAAKLAKATKITKQKLPQSSAKAAVPDAAEGLNFEAAVQAEADALHEFRRLPYGGRVGDTISNTMLVDAIVKAIVQCEETRSDDVARDRRRRGKQELAKRKREQRKQQRSRRSGLGSDAAGDASPATTTASILDRSAHRHHRTREHHHPVFFSTAHETPLPEVADLPAPFALDASSSDSDDEISDEDHNNTNEDLSSTAVFPLMPPSTHVQAVKSFLNQAAVLTLIHHMCVHSKRLFYRYNADVCSVSLTRAFNPNPKDKLAKSVAGVGRRSDKLGNGSGFGGMGVGCQVVLHEGGFVSVRSYQVGRIIPQLNVAPPTPPTACTHSPFTKNVHPLFYLVPPAPHFFPILFHAVNVLLA